jgi:hypothetical protein
MSSALGGGVVGSEKRFSALAIALFVAAAALLSVSIYAQARRRRLEFPGLF